jgi:hypothetical protein
MNPASFLGFKLDITKTRPDIFSIGTYFCKPDPIYLTASSPTSIF